MNRNGFTLLFLGAFIISVAFHECGGSCVGSTCNKCVASSDRCSWCFQQDFNQSRCDSTVNLINAGCRADLIEDPKGFVEIVKDMPVRDGTRSNPKTIQVQPQLVHIKTRPRKEYSIPMTFRAANNFPVDLYFLFDNSVSMKSTIKSLAKLVDDIGQAIGDVSSNYRFGYGVFQDKVILPFTDTSAESLQNPCNKEIMADSYCISPFEFRHLLSMTENLTAFKKKMQETKLSGNIDHPEGSLDAIMQAVTCKSDIGWRERSRKILIFASNAPFKTAGAGKLAGIVVPNDGQCHLSSEGEYDMQIEQDYPSVSQLTDTVDNHEMHIIFAVTEELRDVFNDLSGRIPQSVVELLADPRSQNVDNKAIKDIIEHKYRKMISEVELIHNNVTGVDVQIRATSDTCQSLGTNKCKGLEIGNEIKFNIDVKVTECPEKIADRKKTVVIYPDFLKDDKLELEIEIICDCDCINDSTHWVEDSSVCSNGEGILKCGVCDCKPDRYGQFCECDLSQLDSQNSNCMRPGQNSSECSDAGKCVCGICECLEGFSGPYCECNDKACDSYQREICGGARGHCACGKCECEDGFTGKSCECPTSNRTCILNGVVCDGVGTCECGQCECEKKYTGKFCENCFLCGADSCDVEIYRACAQCAIVDKDNMGCPVPGCPDTILVDSLQEAEDKICSIKQSDGCFLQFMTMSTESNVTLYVQKTKSCPRPVNMIPIIAGLIGGVVATGILLLILWKVLTSCFDKIEYSKFQEEIKNCKWAQQDNPFYKGATTTYQNPMLDTNE